MDAVSLRDELKELVRSAVRRGTVRLSSGAVSDFYIDGRQVTLAPRGAFCLASVMAAMLEKTEFNALGGPTLGADPIIGALCHHFGAAGLTAPTCFIIRKEEKEHGLGRRIEGPAWGPDARAVIVEDVVTSGGAVLKGIAAVEEAGAMVVKVLAMVDREAGGKETLMDRGYDFEAVFTRSELE